MQNTPDKPRPAIAPAEVHAVSARLAEYTDGLLFGDVWERPGLAPRDRSMVTCAALIALNRAPYLKFHAARALDNGLTPRELSEIVTHLSFYCGWPFATAAVYEIAAIYAERGIGTAHLAASDSPAVCYPEAAEEARRGRIAAGAGAVAPSLADLTETVIFGDLWRNPDLSARDRGLVTVVALIALGLAEKSGAYLNRAMDGGLSEQDFAAALEHLAFYAGWPKVMTAMGYFRQTLEARKAQA